MLESKPNQLEAESFLKDKGFKRLGTELWGTLRVILVSLAIVLPIRYFIAQPFIVRGASMEPNFQDRQYLIIDEASYYLREPIRGETIVFRYPKDPRQFFIKRIIALPGEKIEIQEGRVKIFNSVYPAGFILEEEYLNLLGHPIYPELISVLQGDQYFVMGDNRDFSSDSRIWGPLDRKFIIGKVFFRAWPFSKFGTIPDFSFNF